jgi:uncharacterized protein (TIGR02246 family)
MSARDLYAQLIAAWNARDADAFARLFADDGVSIGFDGSQAAGAEIHEHLSAVFGDHETAAYVAKVHSARALGDGVELLLAIAGMVPPGTDELNPKVNALHTLLSEGGRIVLFQNTPAQYHGRPELVEEHTAELERVRSSGAAVG